MHQAAEHAFANRPESNDAIKDHYGSDTSFLPVHWFNYTNFIRHQSKQF
jgi:hypothetical protein